MPGPTVTGYAPVFGGLNAYSMLDGDMPTRDRIRRVVNREGFRAYTALFNALIGVVPGSNVTATHQRVSHNQSPNGIGIEPANPVIRTVTDINRNTTAADVTALKALVFGVSERPNPYPRDLSGNGGPAY